MDTFQITIQRQSPEVPDGWPVVAEYTRAGAIAPVRVKGKLRLDGVALRAQVGPRDYGAVLGRAPFDGAIRPVLL